jgi:hypothetical protein
VTRKPVPRSSRNISRRDDSARVFSTGLGWPLSSPDSRPRVAGRRSPGTGSAESLTAGRGLFHILGRVVLFGFPGG